MLETRLVQQERTVHLKDGILRDVIRKLERGLHRADVADDGERVLLVALVDLGEGELLR